MAQHPLWQLQPPECDGTYTFSGKLLITRTIHQELPVFELQSIIQQVRAHVAQHHGSDYLLVFRNPAGQKIFCIDQLSTEMKQSGDFSPHDDYWTILFSHEY